MPGAVRMPIAVDEPWLLAQRYLWDVLTPAVQDAAQAVRSLLADGPVSGEDLWRFGVLQLLDDYDSVLTHQGVDAAATLMTQAPEPTGHSGLDAAFAGLACWLADRDGWDAPLWAMVQSPAQFRIRGVFITDTALQRV